MSLTFEAFAIGISLGLGVWILFEAYENSYDTGHVAWKKLGISLIFFGLMAILVAWLG